MDSQTTDGDYSAILFDHDRKRIKRWVNIEDPRVIFDNLEDYKTSMWRGIEKWLVSAL